ncbi:FAD-dependent monooxygenase [Streptomyces sp. NPDC101175]|uniref:FAD-dependent monooxygenase n=1 Tax=Streptomyces sp. NPDC101175 TaxID=3366123 RepID=UPI003837DE67
MNDTPDRAAHRTTTDVLVVGAGPTGTALAVDLARRDVDVRVVDRSAHAFDGSRAKGVQPRTLEVLHDLGALADVLDGGSPYPPLGIHLGPLTLPWRMYRVRRATVDVPYPNTWLIPQYRTDRVLHARLGRLGHEVEFGRTLEHFTQGPETVTATVVGEDGTVEEITARYLVGADGGSSTVRRQLGIEFTGTTDEQDRMIIVDAETSGLAPDRWHVWPGPGGRFVGACPLPHTGLFQWMIRLAPGEEPELDERWLTERIRSHTRDRRLTLSGIRWTSVFRPNIRLAARYRRGRVLLAGDAAHVHTPAGAQGLNTGVQDAYNLGWKLAQVLAGADRGLLDSYEAERLPIAAAVLGLSTEKCEAVGAYRASAVRRGKDESQLALSYRDGPLAAGGGDRTRTLRVGDRAPDAEVPVAADLFRLFDLCRGPHFTAVAHGTHAEAALDRIARLDWPSAGARLKRVVLATGDPQARGIRRGYGLTGDTLLLIRPDGYIGHIATRDWYVSTRAAVRALTPALFKKPAAPEVSR